VSNTAGWRRTTLYPLTRKIYV